MDEGKVLSVYVDLDPSQYPTLEARRTQVASLVDRALRVLDADGLSHDERRWLAADVDRVQRWVRDDLDPTGGTWAVAIFACEPQHLFETVELRRSVPGDVRIGAMPYIEPLVGALPPDDWCVFLVNRRSARILRGTRDRLDERLRISDDVHRQHSQGGWSQARYERSVGESVNDHLKHACSDWSAASTPRSSWTTRTRSSSGPGR